MLIYTLPDGRQLKQGQAFELDGIKYPRRWLERAAPDDLAALGITVEEVPDPEPEPQPPTVDDVIRERARRLALGFDYDFGDVRGVHHIGTTAQDMEGWDEVTTFATALINAGDTTTKIEIDTNTGPAEVTAAEWNNVLLAAAQFRQPIWRASFLLQRMDPIPADYADDKWWPQGTVQIETGGLQTLVPSYTVATLPAGRLGQIAYASNGRKSGEDEGQGTGVLVFWDGSGWKATDTGATVAA